MKKVAFFSNQADKIDYVFPEARQERIKQLANLHPRLVNDANFEEELPHLQDLEAIFSTWGMLKLTAEQIAQLPALKAVFYAAGSVKPFGKPLLDAGIVLCSAQKANAVPVAEYTIAHILLACKGFFPNAAQQRKTDDVYWKHNSPAGRGIYEQRVAILGLGAIGQKVVELLQPFNLEVVEVASRPSRRTISLEEAFETCYIVSNHFPDREDNKGVFNKALFERMPQGATFINTGRGAQVNELDLVEVFSKRTDLTAILDVTKPEPPAADSPLRQLPNVHLSSHISGSINSETLRMADDMIQEFDHWQQGKSLENQIDHAMLEQMA